MSWKDWMIVVFTEIRDLLRKLGLSEQEAKDLAIKLDSNFF